MVPEIDTLDVEGYPCTFPNWDNTQEEEKRVSGTKFKTRILYMAFKSSRK